jgi:hypothetical protein
MESEPNYEWLINRGFKIIRENRNRIEIKTIHGGWSFLCEYSPHIWNKLLENDKTIKD